MREVREIGRRRMGGAGYKGDRERGEGRGRCTRGEEGEREKVRAGVTRKVRERGRGKKEGADVRGRERQEG